MILRLYGEARAVYPRDQTWSELVELFPPLPGTRQIYDLSVDLVQTSCGMSVPFFDYAGQRDDLREWAERKGEEKLLEYRREKNVESIDGKPTYLLEDAPQS